MNRVRLLVCAAAIAVSSLAGGLILTPAHGCFGDPCDSLCDTINDLNELLPPKLKLTNCQLG